MSVRSLNKVILIGNLTRDPVLRYTPNNAAVCSFGLATNRTWASADGGEKQEKVEYHQIVAWGKVADICAQILHKGDKVFVEGRIQYRDWKTEDGQERKTTEIVIDNMILLSSGKGGRVVSEDGLSGMDEAPRSGSSKSSKKSKTNTSDDSGFSDDSVDAVEDIADDIPF